MKYELELRSPWLNAAGTLGYTPDRRQPIAWERLGAFVTNPISLAPRTPAQGTRIRPYSGGFLLHTGHPNPGASAVIRRFARRWAQSSLPVWAHLLARDPQEVRALVQRFEGLAGVAALEIGLPPDADVQLALEFARAAMGELPVVLCLPPENAAGLAAALNPEHLTALSLASRRGLLSGSNQEPVPGRLYGPALFPQTFATLKSLLQLGLPVIAGGGVYTPEQGETLLAAGALAVQLDAVLWRHNPFITPRTDD